MQILDGVIGVESENDFLIEANDIPEIEEVNDKFFEYSQAKYQETYNSCTIFGSAGAVSDLFDYKFSYEELLDFNEESYTHGRIRGKGWWVYMAVDLVREMWNEKNENKLLSFRTSIDDGTMVDALNKGHSLVTSYHGNKKYNNDFKENGKLDGVEFGQPTYGHCIRTRKIGGLVHVVDNYFPREYNVYELVDFRELVKRGVYSKFQYLFLPEKSLDKTKEELKLISTLKKMKKLNSYIWKFADNVEGYDDVKKELHELNVAIDRHVE